MTPKPKSKPEVFVDFGRQLDIFNPEIMKKPITVVGVGGIGSPTVMVLAKMGCPKITIYDPDTIEHHNLPNQFFRLADIGRTKVEALKEVTADFSGLELEARPELFEKQTVSGIVICATDSMKSRKAVFQKAKYNPNVPLFIDARMGGEVARIYAINPCDPDDIEFYERNCYSDDEAVPDRCTAKAIIYNVFAIASLIGNLIKKYANRQKLPKEIILDLVNLTLISQ